MSPQSTAPSIALEQFARRPQCDRQACASRVSQTEFEHHDAALSSCARLKP